MTTTAMMTSSTTNEESNNDTANQKKKPLVIVIAGPTAVGKSAVAASLCSPQRASQILSNYVPLHEKEEAATTEARGHIVSADSVQAYTGVFIGANKPSQEELDKTPHHLINVVSTEDEEDSI
eukprot:8395230-Ditylum_brightwellii.AAC.1